MSEQLPVVVPLLLDGLNDNWRCLYLGSPESLTMIDFALRQRGVDIERETMRGALVLSSDRSHLVGGKFDPIAMVDGLCSSIDQAVTDGFAGLCATGDMRWELGADENFEHLLEYEARLEQVFRDKPLRGICQYHRDILPAEAVRNALVSHRATYVGQVLNRDNLFYIPPELLLETRDATARQGEWMCQQIVRVLAAERTRDHALTEQRRLTEQLAELNRNLERRVAERTADLEIANRQLEAFAYSVSHDLRAPLRAVTAFSDLLATDSGQQLEDTGRTHLERVRTNARRMEELIDGMLELAQLANVVLRRVSIDLGELVKDTVGDLRQIEPHRHVEVDIAPNLRANGDVALVRAVITNLIENAWKFTSKRANARIEIGEVADTDGSSRIFFVRDNGAGFDMRYVQKLFGVFQRLHGESEFPGNGIGLATVQRIISRHGGRVWAEGRVDHGATFFFTLPEADQAS